MFSLCWWMHAMHTYLPYRQVTVLELQFQLLSVVSLFFLLYIALSISDWCKCMGIFSAVFYK